MRFGGHRAIRHEFLIYLACIPLRSIWLIRIWFAKVSSKRSAEAGYFDVVINNAGAGHFDPVASISSEVVSQQFQILVFAQIALCQLALGAMQKRGSGLIINVSSLAARLPVPFMSAYNAAKAAMASFSMTLQLELRDSKVRVVDLQPADICTSFNDAVVKPAFG